MIHCVPLSIDFEDQMFQNSQSLFHSFLFFFLYLFFLSLFIFLSFFLDASSHLYKRVCPFVGRQVRSQWKIKVFSSYFCFLSTCLSFFLLFFLSCIPKLHDATRCYTMPSSFFLSSHVTPNPLLTPPAMPSIPFLEIFFFLAACLANLAQMKETFALCLLSVFDGQ